MYCWVRAFYSISKKRQKKYRIYLLPFVTLHKLILKMHFFPNRIEQQYNVSLYDHSCNVKRFYFQIVAKGGNTTHNDKSNITVFLINQNDNDPQFRDRSYVFEIYENSANGTAVGQVSVSIFFQILTGVSCLLTVFAPSASCFFLIFLNCDKNWIEYIS